MARGGVAHLGERLNGIQEVRGSIPLISTTKKPVELTFYRLFSFTITHFEFYSPDAASKSAAGQRHSPQKELIS